MEEYPYWISSFKDFQAKVMEKSDEIDYLLEVYNVIKKNYSISTYELTQKLNQTQGSKLQAWEAMGAATDKDISDYFRLSLTTVREMINRLLSIRLSLTTVREMINRLLSNGRIIRVELEGCNDQHYLLKEDYDFINSPSFQEEPTHCTFLSPFDKLIWYRQRMSRMFDVDYLLGKLHTKNKKEIRLFCVTDFT